LTVKACVSELLCMVISSLVFLYFAILSTCLLLTVLDTYLSFSCFFTHTFIKPSWWIPSLVSLSTHHCYFSDDISVHPSLAFFFTSFIISTNICPLHSFQLPTQAALATALAPTLLFYERSNLHFQMCFIPPLIPWYPPL
jgi:hypothetical protein